MRGAPPRRLAISAVVGLVAVLLAATAPATDAASKVAAPRCDGVHLRSGAGTTHATIVTVDRSDRLTVVDEVHGGYWSSVCAGSTRSGRVWAVISTINGKTVKAKFGVKYVYAGAGLLRTLRTVPTATPTAAATATATATATASPSETPAATLAPPSPAPTPTAAPTATITPSPTPAESASAATSSPDATAAPSVPGGGAIALEIAIVILAVLSTALAALAVWQRRRRRREQNLDSIPPSRFDDVRS